MPGRVETEKELGGILWWEEIEGDKRLQNLEEQDYVDGILQFEAWQQEYHLHGLNHAHKHVDQPSD